MTRARSRRRLPSAVACAALAATAVVAHPSPSAGSPTGVTGKDSGAPAASRPALPRWRATGEAALTGVGVDWRAFGARVELHPGRPGMLGETVLATRTVRLYVRPGQSVAFTRRVLAHELGHALDQARLTDGERDAWLAARGATGTPWLPGPGDSDFGTGAGDFAEVFARWVLGTSDFRSTVAPAPSADQLRALAERFFVPELGALRSRTPSPQPHPAPPGASRR